MRNTPSERGEGRDKMQPKDYANHYPLLFYPVDALELILGGD